MQTQKPFNPRWRYSGDMDIREGGFFWRPSSRDPFPQADYVDAVRVTPCSDAGGPDNVYLIESGSIYIPRDKYESALECCGYDLMTGPRGALMIQGGTGESVHVDSPQGRAMLVDAFLAYHGVERESWNGEHYVQIGPRDSFYEEGRGGWNPRPDKVVRANTSLERYVRREFLS